MGVWEFVEDAVRAIAIALLLLTLGWTAIERGRVHRQWAGQRGTHKSASVDWWVATSAVVGCL